MIREKLLAHPRIFDTWQNLVGADGAKRWFVEEYLVSQRIASILEIGCGTGALCRYLPLASNYVGVDISAEYISEARETFPDRRFIVGDVSKQTFAAECSAKYDVIVAFGVLHHLTDRAAVAAIRGASSVLNDQGKFLSVDPCAGPNQHLAERVLKTFDRGRYIRSGASYSDLASSVFRNVEYRTESSKMSIHYELAVVEASDGLRGHTNA